MATLPPKPKGNLPSLYEARSAHLQPQTLMTGDYPRNTSSSAHQRLRFDRFSQALHKVDANANAISIFVPEAPQEQQASSVLATITRTGGHGYGVHKRKASEPGRDNQAHSARKRSRVTDAVVEDGDVSHIVQEFTLVQQAEISRKRARPDDDDDFEEGEIVDSDDLSSVACSRPAKKRRKNKHKPRGCKKAKSQVVLEFNPADLVPHYRPYKDIFIRSRNERLVKSVCKPVKFVDLNQDCRRIVFGKVFEDEAYRFKILRYCARDSWKHMRATVPPSFGCLLINKTFGAEAAEEMYKSVRLELNFGKLRPEAVRRFMDKVGTSIFGEKYERIFFIKKFGLQKINFGRLKRAKEIVSEHWTVDGSKAMDNDDYKNNRVTPAFVLDAPEDSGQKGLKQLRCWTDHKKAMDRYQAHLESRCHPLMKDPDAEDPDEAADRMSCPFGPESCTNLEKTLFVMVVKYKYGCVKGRHARQKEVWYDLHPPQRGQEERLEQTSPFQVKYHKKIGKSGFRPVKEVEE